MAATIITVTEIGASGTNIKIKVNDGHIVPSDIITDTVQNFRTWRLDTAHFFTWKNDQGLERSMLVPLFYIGWIVSSISVGEKGNRFSINAPCNVTVEAETI